MSQGTAIAATKILKRVGVSVSRDDPLPVDADLALLLGALTGILQELKAIRMTLSQASNIFINPEDTQDGNE